MSSNGVEPELCFRFTPLGLTHLELLTRLIAALPPMPQRSPDFAPVLRIVGLFQKPIRGALVEPVPQLQLRRGRGIEGDANAVIGSPRQVLFASLPALTDFGLAPGAMQENLLLSDWIEALPSGAVVQLGAQAQVRLTFLCEPCASLERLKPGLSRQIHGKRGMLGMVVRDGVVCPGDEVQILPLRLPALSEKTRDRLHEFVARIPPGHVVCTRDLLLALGLTPSYARAIPAMLKKSPHLPVHRIVSVEGALLSRHLPNQEALLAEEGVAVSAGRVELTFSWNPMEFHDLGPSEVGSG